eukprot:TRINITY_DN19298_c0_g1_i2.p1 TRINITY_DN19298_c0_g1~~TRINITY_DN19298_c0_g1_i2.p1  ORF type:complete len:271 (-),score=73.49 TRINITY_DN19298_c0_g1_i2:479-1291(-)
MDGTKKDWMAPHLHLGKGILPPMVLVAGDPGRVQKIANMCDSAEQLANNREYMTYKATHQGHSFAICSHGIGTAGAAICFEELIQCGAKCLIRLGTCGGLQQNIGQGDLILATAACRDDGTTKLMAPVELPAVADIEIVSTLRNICLEHAATSHLGLVLTSDLFYPSKLESNLKLFSDCGVLGVEMEVACLFMVAQLRGIKAGAICTVDGNPLQWEEGNYDPDGEVVNKGKTKMLEIGIAAACKIAADYFESGQDGNNSPSKKRKVEGQM